MKKCETKSHKIIEYRDLFLLLAFFKINLLSLTVKTKLNKLFKENSFYYIKKIYI